MSETKKAEVFRIRLRRVLVLLFVIVATVLAVGMPQVRLFLAVDRCLDRGGRWDDSQQICETDDWRDGATP